MNWRFYYFLVIDFMRFGEIGLKGDKGLFILLKNIRVYKRFVYRMSGYYSIKSCRYVIFHKGSGCVFSV